MTAKISLLESNRYMVSGDLNFTSVPDIWRKSQEIFASAGNAGGSTNADTNAGKVDIDLSEVSRSDSAGLALLIEWMRYANNKGLDIKFHNIPTQMQEIARVCGVADQLPAD